MPSKRGVVRTDAIGRNTQTPFRDPGAMSGLLTGVSFIGGVGGGVALANSPYPRPGSEPAEVSRYFTENSRSARLSATGQLISTASLARFAASVARLGGRSGNGSRGLRAAAIAGGWLATASLATSGLHTLSLSGRWGKEDDSAATLARRAFAAGGPIHGVGFGVLTGALALAGLRTGDLGACVGGLWHLVAALLRQGVSGVAYTDRALLRAGGERDRGGQARPPGLRRERRPAGEQDPGYRKLTGKTYL